MSAFLIFILVWNQPVSLHIHKYTCMCAHMSPPIMHTHSYTCMYIYAYLFVYVYIYIHNYIYIKFSNTLASAMMREIGNYPFLKGPCRI